MAKSDVKSRGPTTSGHSKLVGLRAGEETGMVGVAVKCVEIDQNTGGEGGSLDSS